MNGAVAGALRRLRRRTRDRHRADDLRQHVLAAAAAGLPDAPTGDSAVLAWLYAVARRRFVDEARRQGSENRVDLPEARGSLDYGPFVARALRDALADLPRGQSRVIVLKLLRGMTFAEIGADVGLSESATSVRFSRALEALREELMRGTEHAS